MEKLLMNKNTLVFVDYENVHFNLINQFKNVFEINFFKKLKQFLTEKNEMNLIDVIAYCNFDIEDMHKSFHQTALQHLGIDTRHTTNNGKNYADIQITTDAMEAVYNNQSIDIVVIISNDKDMTPLIKSLRKANTEVYLILFKENFDRVLLEFPTKYFFIEDILSIELSDIENTQDAIHKNICEYMDKQNSGKSTPFLYSLENCMNSLSGYFKTFEYEIIRIFSLLEKENKIFMYKYKKGTGKEYIGISTSKYESLYSSFADFTITKITGYFTETVIKEYYKKFQKKSEEN